MNTVNAALDSVKGMAGYGTESKEEGTDNPTTGTSSTHTAPGNTTTEERSGPTSQDPTTKTKATPHDANVSDPTADAKPAGSGQPSDEAGLTGPTEAGTGEVKMSGTGAPGSHSALFGLTPKGRDGDEEKKESDE